MASSETESDHGDVGVLLDEVPDVCHLCLEVGCPDVPYSRHVATQNDHKQEFSIKCAKRKRGRRQSLESASHYQVFAPCLAEQSGASAFASKRLSFSRSTFFNCSPIFLSRLVEFNETQKVGCLFYDDFNPSICTIWAFEFPS